MRLIIKAPDPSIGDYSVEASSEWSVAELKECLAHSHPNQPMVSGQRLIYAGQLLQDHLLLRDILRHEESAEDSVHTLHLAHVYTQIPSRPPPSTIPPTTPINVTPPSYPSAVVPNWENQMAALQQYYAQYYAQFFQRFQPPPPPNAPPAPVTPPQPELRLDWFEPMCLWMRFGLLFTILCLYSTPERLAVVIVFFTTALLYQEGYFGDFFMRPPARAANEGDLQAAMDGDQPPHTQPPAFNPINFLSSFFSSLIPPRPPALN